MPSTQGMIVPTEMKLHIILVIFLSCIIKNYAETAAETNMQGSSEPRQFKMGKMNAVWQKAQKVLKGSRLGDLYADLVIQDKREKDLKAKRHDGKDPDGLLEAETRKEFVGILRKYNLGDFFPRDMEGSEKYTKMNPPDIRDEKLKKLWKKALLEGFTDSELGTLREELGHQQVKLDEFETLKLEYDTLQDKIDNSLEDGQDRVWRHLEDRKKAMKEHHHKLKDDYQQMENKFETGDRGAEEFDDPRVHQLWALARKSGMSIEELQSFKEELNHFQHRIRKAEHMENEAKRSAEKLEIDPDNEHAVNMKDMASQYKRKVEKIHADLKYRVHKRIDEL